METIGSRLKKMLQNKGVTAYEASKATGIAESTLSRIITHNTKPNSKNRKILAEYFGVSEDWYITDEVEAIPVDFKLMSTMHVPFVNQYAYGGYLSGFGDQEYLENLPTLPWSNDQEHKGDYLCFEVKGDSMDDGSWQSILEGDILLCRNIRKDYWKSKLHIHKWDFVIVHQEKGIIVKRIIKHDVDAGIITIHSLNDFYDDQEIDLREVSQILNIVDIKRKGNRR